MTKRGRKRGGSRSMPVAILRGALPAVGTAVAAVALMTLLVYLDVLGEGAVSAVGAALKILCAVLAALLAVRGTSGGLLCGGLAGAVFTVLSTACMWLLAGELVLSWGVLGDVLMGFAVGAAAAALRKTLRKTAET